VNACRFGVVALAIVLIMPAVATTQKRIDFQRDIRPILSDNCFQCHGPDQSTRKANLRLDIQSEAMAGRRNGAPIVPRNPDQSLLYKKITEENPARRMPPPSTHKTLTDAQKQSIRTWIQQGAEWKQHWAFVAPVRPAVPSVSDRSWPRTAIDRFILSKLDASALRPNLEADRHALIRRVSFDLTGLPPSPEEVAAFVNDRSPDAYDKVVDRLLASPHYGEHRARYWLDAARYGDTNGLHYDNYRGGIWPYRDWVVKAFNDNMPFDRFAIEQLAGDLLPDPNLDQLIATGFVRSNTTTNENGVIEDEIRVQYVKDRADTAATVFLGLTAGCATCHDHKFDPILQRDHYALEAFFNNTTERVMDNNRPDPPPIVIVPRAADRKRWEQLEGLTKSLRARMDAARGAASDGFEAWLASPQRRVEQPLADAQIFAVWADKNGAQAARHGAQGAVALPEGVALSEAAPWSGGRALEFKGKSGLAAPSMDLSGDEPFSMTAWVYFPEITLHPGQTGGSHGVVIASQTSAGAPAALQALNAGPAGWVVEIDEGVARLKLLDGSGKVMRAQAPYNKPVTPATWNHFTFTYDGSRKEEGYTFYLNGRPLPLERGSFGGQDSNIAINLQGTLKNAAPVTIGADSAGEKRFAGSIADFRILGRVVTEDEARTIAAWPAVALAAAKPVADLSAAEKDALKLYYLTYHDKSYRDLLQQFTAASTEHRAIELRSDTAMVMEERPDSKPTAHVLFRGMYDQPRELVDAGTPSFLPPMAPGLARNRLGLAQWIVDPANPLFARVTVNRLWQEFFGTGIVATAEDFGVQSEAPSHPELLDWLAVEFRESGWDVKKLIRLITTSAAYRQSAAASPEKIRKDPKNTLLARGPRFRLDAEAVRDSALAASGLLVPKLGGPPVKPYQPAGVWEGTSMVASNTRNYKQDSGEALYRRSLYTLWKRSAPPASMDIFDGPTREACIVRRERTNTPLQALVTMNDTQFVEAARALAERAIHASPKDVDAEIDFMTVRVLARTFNAVERKIVRSAYDDFLKHYQANWVAATQLVAVGESAADQNLPAPEFAALTMVANQLFNLDEALNK
jgi:hypothetical protein